MKLIRHLLITLTAVTLATTNLPAETPAKPAASEINTVCPISGKPVDPKITTSYEGRTYAFAQEACRAKWVAARENSLYHKLGGKAAMDAAVDAFYVKVLADNRVKHFFDDVSMPKQRRKQKEFLSAALGGPLPWTGKDMRKAHEGMGLTDEHFNAIAENLTSTLKDLKVSQELIDQVIAVVATTKDDVLGRPKKAGK
jgi:hemoglobin